MKKIKFVLINLVFVAGVISCSKSDNNFSQLDNPPDNPNLFVGANPGGNVTCEEVAESFGCEFDHSSGRIDYYGGTGPWTVGPITWRTDGTYVTWSSTVPVKIAIIVKGGPNANVYSDCGTCKSGSEISVKLSAPINPNNGRPYGLSNITFCWSYCEGEPVVAFKGFLKNDARHFVSSGNQLFADNGAWCEQLGYNAPSTIFDVVISPATPGEDPVKIGTASISAAGVITINLTEGEVDYIHTFVGTVAELQASAVFVGSYGCPRYTDWPITDY